MLRTASRWGHHAARFRLHHFASLFVGSHEATKTQLLFRGSTPSPPVRRAAGSRTSSQALNASSTDGFDPYAYTSGRWLRNDKLERDARYIKFNYDALCKRVIELCPGATSIASCEKKDGGFGRVFIFTCDSARRVVAKLPTSVAGPPRLITNSEVATITYLQSSTTVPIPKILDWSDDSSNAIGHEYIISEHAVGTQLSQKWPTMTEEQQIDCIQAIFKNIQQVAAIDFPAYGSLYLINAPLDSDLKIHLTPGFCVGPHCGTRYWDCTVGEARHYNSAKPNRGPWSGLTAYCNALIDIGLSRLPVNCTTRNKRPFDGSVAAHTELLDAGRKVIQMLSEEPRIQEAGLPTLYHADLHKRNIFVSDSDPTVITAFIDWQSSSIEPAFEYADDTPDFAAPAMDISPEDQHTGTHAELCRLVFDACLKCLVPKLAAARALDETLMRPFRYCHRTWKDGAVAFREDLIEISRSWKELGLAGSCPYELPTSDELLAHQKEYEIFVNAHKLKQDMMSILDTTSNGWVNIDLWETTNKAHKETFDELVRALGSSESTDDESMSTEDLRNIWPFDINQDEEQGPNHLSCQ